MKHCVDEDDAHADVDTHLKRNLEEAAERDAHAAHLADYVGDRHYDQANHGDQTSGFGVEALADELRHREFAELAQVGREQQGQQHVTAGPAHQVDGGIVAQERDQAGHRDKRGR
jgi:hypothetical protein